MSDELKSFEDLRGHTITKVTVNDDHDEMYFTIEDGSTYMLYHNQDCCERVSISDICGDLDRIVGQPVLLAEEATNHYPDGDYSDSCTWTFYKLATIKGYVTIRWYGESNGYYSERVDWCKTTD